MTRTIPTSRTIAARLVPGCATLALLATGAGAIVASGASAATTAPPAHGHSILASRLLWATIDVCNPPDQKDTIGVRGSMPGDGAANETMFMRFRIQYRNAKTGQWQTISSADSGYVNVKSARYRVREAGTSFVFRPAPGQPAYRLRGLVLFQWRRGATVVRSTSRYTAGGHASGAGADPKNYTATTCIIP